MAQNRVVFDKGPNGGASCFADPVRVIRADTVKDVAQALDQLCEALDDGYWLAGYFSYELGYCFSEKLTNLMPKIRSAPLINVGVFAEPQSLDMPAQSENSTRLSSLKPSLDLAQYQEKFASAHRYIRAGDIYQVNLTFPMSTRSSASPWDLYQALAGRQPVDFGAFVDLGGPVILSRSPELFFEVDDAGMIETRPMKGTVRRGHSVIEDTELKEWLSNSEKNRAENLMIVDLLRNDISRVCEVGTVEVPHSFTVETFATVHQMTSAVRGRLRPDVALPDILQALFPCGSVTGAPKVRAMQIIAELEHGPRELYCGSIGWAAPNGRMQFNVAIRTLIAEQGGELRLNVGGGVVYDSTASEEYQEALLKAQFAHLID